jgi:hypothetical protein
MVVVCGCRCCFAVLCFKAGRQQAQGQKRERVVSRVSTLYLMGTSCNPASIRKCDWCRVCAHCRHVLHPDPLRSWTLSCLLKKLVASLFFASLPRQPPETVPTLPDKQVTRLMSGSLSNLPSLDAHPQFQRAGSVSQASERSQTAQEQVHAVA